MLENREHHHHFSMTLQNSRKQIEKIKLLISVEL